jgi:hypothetical protein
MADQAPAGASVKPFGSRRGIRRQANPLEAGGFQHLTRAFKQGTPDSATAVLLVHEQCPDEAVAGVHRREAGDFAIFFPDKDAGIGDEPIDIVQGNLGGIGPDRMFSDTPARISTIRAIS